MAIDPNDLGPSFVPKAPLAPQDDITLRPPDPKTAPGGNIDGGSGGGDIPGGNDQNSPPPPSARLETTQENPPQSSASTPPSTEQWLPPPTPPRFGWWVVYQNIFTLETFEALVTTGSRLFDPNDFQADLDTRSNFYNLAPPANNPQPQFPFNLVPQTLSPRILAYRVCSYTYLSPTQYKNIANKLPANRDSFVNIAGFIQEAFK